MYPLFETTRLLALPPATKDHPGSSIILSSFAENTTSHVLVLVCENGQLVFLIRHAHDPRPLVRSLWWSPAHQPHTDGDVAAICLDSSAASLALATTGAIVHVFALSGLQNVPANAGKPWVADDTRGIHLTTSAGKPTCVCWWQTLKGTPILVVGTEVGE